MKHGDVLELGDWQVQVIDVSGHTNGHVAYHIPKAELAFVGDAVFALGCGRMFEGTPDQFWASLCRIKALPAATWLYCAHEYTQSNARFALHATGSGVEFADVTEDDWAAEYYSLDIAAGIVDSIDDALAHIRRWSSGHTEAIVTQDSRAAGEFLARVDAGCVFHNASTRFADGGASRQHPPRRNAMTSDRKSTRLNSSH